ncbi:hypothetical protein [Psychrobium sp. 1_MG-2023]|uniref:hypothetical protein n=1 Tax=Psychrobium sp. 1_MG-2023 TaxID=3062624 RepID=UPI000C32D704|nr:hypothetical protein [Psychrobium sp. 1_MG-2023]MDP2561513.1 hypothetical protein [Psychrobium sp. 1_MG-2023]PKF54978.1 hypothetical protein CW748_14445 [Alteromonadales bacterium alter-6D02]
MDKHHFRLKWLFMGLGSLGLLLSVFVLPQILTLFEEVWLAMPDQQSNIPIVLSSVFTAIMAMCLIGGILLARKQRLAHTVLPVVSVLLLLSFPVGTCLGCYYFWYKIKVVNN